jgi:2-C-methyl-D-erythritol 4-phosphate cytidylyltransferase
LIRVLALIPAAGTGSRAGAITPKQYVRLGDRTMLEHAIEAVLADSRVSRVLVAVAPQDQRWPALSLDARARCAPVGGASRAASVRNGLAALKPSNDDWVLVHDAARPCLTSAELARLLDAVQEDDVGGLLALPVADTLKRARDHRVVETVDRRSLWRALTPQIFRARVLSRALDGAASLDSVTDEAAAVEGLGMRPLLVPGDATNIKVTTAADWPLAEAILTAQGRMR